MLVMVFFLPIFLYGFDIKLCMELTDAANKRLASGLAIVSVACYRCSNNALFCSCSNIKNEKKDEKYLKQIKNTFTCFLCEQQFTANNSLKNHMLIHANIKPLYCALCHIFFRTSATFQRHNKSVHLKIKTKLCPFPGCKRCFSRKDSCQKHFKIHFKAKKQ